MGNAWSEDRSASREVKLALVATGLVAGAVSYFVLSRKNDALDTSMLGRVCVVTGANVGIGKAAATALAAKGATVVLACRSVEKAHSAAREIVEKTKNSNVIVQQLDLADLSSVQKFVNELQRQNLRVNVLVNNAGALNPKLDLVHGVERTFFVNHVGPFFLTNLLLPTLNASSKESGVPSQIVNVASRLEKRAKLNLECLDGSQGYDMWQAYSDSKFCNLLFTYELHRRLISDGGKASDDASATPVIVNAVTPGIVNSSLGRNAPTALQVLSAPLRYLLMRTPEKGAETVVFAATAAVENASGKYWRDCKLEQSSMQSHDPQLAKALWQRSQTIIDRILQES